jgi:hypothetical protein
MFVAVELTMQISFSHIKPQEVCKSRVTMKATSDNTEFGVLVKMES